MQRYLCGRETQSTGGPCPSCGRPFSRLIYAPFLAVLGGIVGSFVGFTLAADLPTAFLGGLLGILAAEACARIMLRPRVKNAAGKD